MYNVVTIEPPGLDLIMSIGTVKYSMNVFTVKRGIPITHALTAVSQILYFPRKLSYMAFCVLL